MKTPVPIKKTLRRMGWMKPTIPPVYMWEGLEEPIPKHLEGRVAELKAKIARLQAEACRPEALRDSSNDSMHCDSNYQGASPTRRIRENRDRLDVLRRRQFLADETARTTAQESAQNVEEDDSDVLSDSSSITECQETFVTADENFDPKYIESTFIGEDRSIKSSASMASFCTASSMDSNQTVKPSKTTSTNIFLWFKNSLWRIFDVGHKV